MTITVKISEETKNKMKEFYNDDIRVKTPPYALFQADCGGNVITVYESGKAVFQGTSADIDANMWVDMERHLNPHKLVEITNSEDKKNKDKDKTKDTKDPKYYYASTIGSDEVGTGDLFGPIVVCATYVNKEQIPYLENLGIKDSKKLDDSKILEIAPEIIKTIKFEAIILSNEQYNQNHSKELNMNKIKAILHNKVLLKLNNQNYKYDYIIVDQFAEKYVYFNYLKEIPEVIRNITFLTKAEDKSLSVACASIISRYLFLKEFDKMSKEIGINIPKGASTKVDEVLIHVYNKHGEEALKKYVKMNFKNLDKLKSL